MGEVWEGQHDATGARVAIKLLHRAEVDLWEGRTGTPQLRDDLQDLRAEVAP